MSTRRALLIGCAAADYPGVETSARALAAVLLLHHRFTSVTLLLGADATSANIRRAFATLAADTRPGDAVAIYYAGHASHFRLDAPTGEGQLRLTLIAPSGVERSTAGDFRGLLEADFSRLILDVMRRTDNVTVILDCCDGENMADLRALQRAPELQRAFEELLRQTAIERFAEVGEHHETPCVRPRGPGFVLLSASAAGTTSFPHPDGDGLLFTSLLCDALRDPAAAGHSWHELLALVRGELQRMRSAQYPALSGARFRRPFLLDTARPDHEFRLGRLVDGQIVTAGPEFFHGVTIDDRFELVGFDWPQGPAPRLLGHAVVERLSPRLRLRPVAGAELPRLVYARQVLLRGALTVEPAALAALRPGATAEDLFPGLCTREPVKAAVRHNPARATIDVHDHDGHLVTRVRLDQRDALERVRAAALRVIRWQQLSAAIDVPTYPAFAPGFAVHWGELVVTAAGLRERRLADNASLRADGPPMFLRLVGRAPDLHVRAVRVRVDRSIVPWDDHEWSPSLAEGESRTLGPELWGPMRALTLDWPHHTLADLEPDVEGHESLLLIVSDAPFSGEMLPRDDCEESAPGAREPEPEPEPRFFLHRFCYRLTR